VIGSEIFVDFEAAIDATDFNAADFETSPGLLVPTDVSQETATQIRLDLAEDGEGEAVLNYNGSVAGVCTPQSVPLVVG
jgi:hypothetical protein